MKATFPIITCDHEDGCDQWTLDWYSALASNWRELMADGWTYDPHAPGGEQFCPEHHPCAPDCAAPRPASAECPLSERVDGPLHSWRFDGDDPYTSSASTATRCRTRSPGACRPRTRPSCVTGASTAVTGACGPRDDDHTEEAGR